MISRVTATCTRAEAQHILGSKIFTGGARRERLVKRMSQHGETISSSTLTSMHEVSLTPLGEERWQFVAITRFHPYEVRFSDFLEMIISELGWMNICPSIELVTRPGKAYRIVDPQGFSSEFGLLGFTLACKDKDQVSLLFYSMMGKCDMPCNIAFHLLEQILARKKSA